MNFVLFGVRLCIHFLFGVIADYHKLIKNTHTGNFLAVQWLGFHAFTDEGPSSIPSQGTKILQVAWQGQIHTHAHTTHTHASIILQSWNSEI